MLLKDPANHIIDIYEGEYPVNLAAMNPRPLRTIIRASWQRLGARTRGRDAKVIDYVNQCKALGLKYGLYHFLTPHGIAEQAALFLGVWNEVKGADMAPIVDVEVDLAKYYTGTASVGNAVWQGHAKTFIDLIASGTGRTPIIYTNEYYWNTFVRTRSGLIWYSPTWTKDYPLWVAQYPTNPDTASAPARLPAGWNSWAMWQYNDKGRSNGFLANDLNIASEWFKAELGQVVEPPPVEPPATDPDYITAHYPDGTEKRYVPE